jgi:NAD(P)-dependent dehydrogenase (short-subunit alcohol dehydrogenase family)
MFPPAPGFTESSLPDLHGKVYIVTGASAGVGKELSRLLYSRNGVVYVAARSSEKASAAISWIKEAHPESKGTLHYLHLDLGDLDGIKASAEAFLKNETRLDVLFNNAGVMVPPKGTTTKQGYELQLGTNCVAPFLFTKALTPMLIETAKKEPKGSVRVIWVSSSAATLVAPTGGVDMDNLNYKKDVHQMTKYGISKGGNVLHAMEFQRRYEEHGIVSVSLNPGNLKSELQRHISAFQLLILRMIMYPPVNGAYTELFAGLAPDVADLKMSEWVVPWGRIMPLRNDYYSEIGKKTAKAFWEWSEKQVEQYS